MENSIVWTEKRLLSSLLVCSYIILGTARLSNKYHLDQALSSLYVVWNISDSIGYKK